jgi:hypothetical protein
MMEDYYLCPFCVSSWVCHGPHIEQKDIEKFYYRMRILQDDLAEFAKELVLEQGDKMDFSTLAKMLEQKLKNREVI